ncbi:MAG: hypothetical protein SPG65_02205 [Campylobacter sp.]|nr:hypothetical protein [Campylobacter sp.]
MRKIVLSTLVALSLTFGVCDDYESCPLSTNCENTDNLTYEQEQVCWGVKSDNTLAQYTELKNTLENRLKG